VRPRAAVAIAIAAVVVGLVPVASAPAQTTGGGELGPGYVRASAADLGAGSFPGSGLPASAPSTQSSLTWTRVGTGGLCVVFPGPIPPALVDAVHQLPRSGGPDLFGVPIVLPAPVGAPPEAVWLDDAVLVPPDVVRYGAFVIDIGTMPGSVVTVPRCALPGAPLPPSPPTAAAIWQQTPLPREAISANPPGSRAWPGIVHLESWFWGAALPDAQAAVSLDGYAVSVVAHPIAYAWSFGDGTTLVAAGPGTPADPARATYRRRGDYPVALYVVWAGRAHVTAPGWGLDLGVQDLGTVTIPERIGYHEAEIRAVLRTRTAG
jgi:hypothetical protein